MDNSGSGCSRPAEENINMSLIRVTYLNGTSEIVTVEEAATLKDNNELLIPENDGKALTIEDVYGEGYGN